MEEIRGQKWVLKKRRTREYSIVVEQADQFGIVVETEGGTCSW